MARRELKTGRQVAGWIDGIAARLTRPATLTLIGSGALLWYAWHRGLPAELPEASMDLDPITDSDEVAAECYAALIGSEFERTHGWHVNLMPDSVLQHLPAETRRPAPLRSSLACCGSSCCACRPAGSQAQAQRAA